MKLKNKKFYGILSLILVSVLVIYLLPINPNHNMEKEREKFLDLKYEIQKSIDEGKGLLGIDISKIKDFQKKTTERCGKIPEGYNFYLWNNDKGHENMGDWIEKAAKNAGR